MVRRRAGEGGRAEVEELDAHSDGEANGDAENIVGHDDHVGDDGVEHVSISIALK